MPVRYVYEDAPGVKTIFEEGKAGILQLFSKKEFSEDHTLAIHIYKVTLYEGCNCSSKIFPLVVGLWEQEDDMRYTDFYSFDNNGVLLSHGFFSSEKGRRIIDEQHDLSLDRLVEHGETIKEMIGDYPLAAQLAMHPTLSDLRGNLLNK